MNPYIGKRKNQSVAESVSRLVAEGGYVLASDDAPTAAGHAPVETTMPANRGRPTSQIRLGASSWAVTFSVARPCICLRPLHSRRKASQARKQSRAK